MRENVHEDVESGRGDGKRLPNIDCVEAVHQLYSHQYRLRLAVPVVRSVVGIPACGVKAPPLISQGFTVVPKHCQ